MTTTGHSYVSIHAGDLETTNTPPTHIGKLAVMKGSGITFYFTPEVAAQWVGVLQTIAEGEK
jgi:hypothetical protein